MKKVYYCNPNQICDGDCSIETVYTPKDGVCITTGTSINSYWTTEYVDKDEHKDNTTKILEYLIGKENVVFIGSRFLGVHTNESDYDFAMTNEDYKVFTSKFKELFYDFKLSNDYDGYNALRNEYNVKFKIKNDPDTTINLIVYGEKDSIEQIKRITKIMLDMVDTPISVNSGLKSNKEIMADKRRRCDLFEGLINFYFGPHPIHEDAEFELKTDDELMDSNDDLPF